MDQGGTQTRLVVFSDDWGRHPSSCQHLVGRLLPRYEALWVNTIGMRSPGLSAGDLKKIAVKLRQWVGGAGRGSGEPGVVLPTGLSVVSPRMWPGFRRPWQRGLNAKLMAGAVNRALGRRRAGETRVAVTTLPITADLVGRLDVDRWVYYCVDDFSVWPGVDGQAMQEMEQRQVRRMDALAAVSETLRQRLSGMGGDSRLLTHGIDLAHWGWGDDPGAGAGTNPEGGRGGKGVEVELPDWCRRLGRPMILFWGLLDPRLDVDWCRRLAESLRAGPGGTLALVGPRLDADPALGSIEGVVMPGPVSYEALPALARQADVLVMPYADLPVTRAMQPLKFKEYLATGKAVVARDLPATREWAGAADLVTDARAFVRAVMERIGQGASAAQREDRRRRLPGESWDHKARQLEAIVTGQGPEA